MQIHFINFLTEAVYLATSLPTEAVWVVGYFTKYRQLFTK